MYAYRNLATITYAQTFGGAYNMCRRYLTGDGCMGDESFADYSKYMADLREKTKASVTYLGTCKFCKGVGHHNKDEPCICVQDYKCPRCGFQHTPPKHKTIGWSFPNRLILCYKCDWTNTIGEVVK